jgi:soluble lytic murein transglycosylase
MSRPAPFARRKAVHKLHFVALLAITICPTALQAQGLEAQRQRFIEARSALGLGEIGRFQALADGLKNYPLYPYLRYAELSARLARTSAGEVQEFLRNYEDTPLAARLRRAWLRLLAGRGDWGAYRAFYTPQDDPVLACHALTAWLRTEGTDAVLEAAKKRWLTGQSQPMACDPAFGVLERSPLITEALVWERIGLAMDESQLGLARHLGRLLDERGRAWVRRWCAAHEQPLAILNDAALREDSPIARTVAAHAVMRLAQSDARSAYRQWQGLREAFVAWPGLLAEVQTGLALEATKQDLPEALVWLDGIEHANADAAVQRARLRAALLASDWVRLVRWTEQPAVPDMNPLRWRYWRARALERTGQIEPARALLTDLAQERDYYGFAAADRIGAGYRMGHRPTLAAPEVEAQLLSRPGFVRARELRLVGMPREARAEWRQSVDPLPDAEVMVAARLAHGWGWHDEVIRLLGKIQAYDDLELRFPMPYPSVVRTEARRQRLEPALVYGFMRAESAFDARARSAAGALGLMQLLPTTGQLVARELGKRLSGEGELSDPATNIALGSRYLRKMLDRYSGHLPMTAAAYNAGPGRVERWRPEGECRDGEIWVETLPFMETRRYVRNILFFTALYEWRLGEEVRPLPARLAAVPPRAGPLGTGLACARSKPPSYG